jgi:hypothetical protein
LRFYPSGEKRRRNALALAAVTDNRFSAGVGGRRKKFRGPADGGGRANHP